MTEYTVVLVIIALVGLFMTVGKPVIGLNTSITKLSDAVDNLQRYQEKQDMRIDNHEERLDNHETRIHDLEAQ